MTTLDLRECDRLNGASNFIPWMFKLQMLLEEAELWEHVEKEIVAPTYLTISALFGEGLLHPSHCRQVDL
jgi:hypothetical protein